MKANISRKKSGFWYPENTWNTPKKRPNCTYPSKSLNVLFFVWTWIEYCGFEIDFILGPTPKKICILSLYHHCKFAHQGTVYTPKHRQQSHFSVHLDFMIWTTLKSPNKWNIFSGPLYLLQFTQNPDIFLATSQSNCTTCQQSASCPHRRYQGQSRAWRRYSQPQGG